MIDKKVLKSRINDALVVGGFRRKGQAWYLDGQDATVVLELQKCDYKEAYFINFGLFLHALESGRQPQPRNCHIQCRLERVFPEDSETISDGASLEQADEVPLRDLVSLLTREVVPFSHECLGLVQIREHFSKGRFPGLIFENARLLLRGP